MANQTFKLSFPEISIEDDLGESCTPGEVLPRAWCLVDVDPSKQSAVEVAAAGRGWEHVGSGDLRPSVPTFTQSYSTTSTTIAALASWSAPGIAANYSAGITLLTGASAADLNDLAGKCATLEAEVAAHRTEITTLKQLINALVDAMQDRGIAA